MIDKTSRYAKVPTASAVDASGEEVTLLALRDIPATTGIFSHTPTGAERLDHLSHRYYRDPLKFWRIADAADELDPADIVVPGRKVLIPPNR
ncbi:MAG: LysM domain-containing protein [Polyangiaceae bacterium]|nr:LysM domain-containing protein [Polyangiaceae bacterium]